MNDLFGAEQTITRKAPRRKLTRAFNGEQAAHVLKEAKFGKGVEVFGFTKGQFSFVDLIEAVLHKTGPADIILSTWAASLADLGRVTLFCDNGLIKSAKFLLDGAFESYNKETSKGLRERFGDENIRIMPNHAKFCLIRNEKWDVAIPTSMNLNQNKRLENFFVIENKEYCDEFARLIEEIWGIQATSAGFGANGYRESSKTLGKLGEGRTSDFFDVSPATAIFR